MCGTGPLEEWCRQFIEENGLTKVELAGFVPNVQVRKIIGESKALVLPTQVYEGFPVTIAESYASGTPVIGSDLGNTGSLIENGKTGLKFNHTSAEDLAEKVEILAKKHYVLDEIYRNKYSSEMNYEIIKRIYKSI